MRAITSFASFTRCRLEYLDWAVHPMEAKMKSIAIALAGVCLMSSVALAAPVKLSDEALGMITAGNRFGHGRGHLFGSIQTNVNSTRQIARSTAITFVTCIA